MKLLTGLLLILTSTLAYGQMAVIQDPDGFTNVRKEANGQGEIIHQIHENEVFWYNPEIDNKQNWIQVYIPKNMYSLGCSQPNYLEGYIHKSRLLRIENLPTYQGENCKFEYSLTDFNSTNRIIDRQEEGWITAIDGRHAWGTDGTLPKIQVAGVKATIEQNEIRVQHVLYNDIYECTNQFSIFKNKDTYFIYQHNSDGAGYYQIVWVLTKDGVQQRLVGTII